MRQVTLIIPGRRRVAVLALLSLAVAASCGSSEQAPAGTADPDSAGVGGSGTSGGAAAGGESEGASTSTIGGLASGAAAAGGLETGGATGGSTSSTSTGEPGTGGFATGGTTTGGTTTGGPGTGGFTTGGTTTGGTTTGGTTTGGTTTGGPGTGGFTTGGTTAGGTTTGGPGTGGFTTGGTTTGGPGTGGFTTGGTTAGGTTTGGSSSGGLGTGAAGAGGNAVGGEGAGGANTGGGATGGDGGGNPGTGGSAEGTCGVAATCGTHKWACWPMPNPEGTGPNPASYTESDGVVHDDVTCLDWEKTPSSGTYTNSEARSYCEGLSLGGYDDWRVPTRVELISTIDWTRSPTTDAVFSPQGGYHNTGSNWILTIQQRGAGTTCGNGDCAWMCNLSDGMCSNAYEASGAISVRCVRGNGAGEGFDDPAVAPADQYTLISDEVAQDNYTRLIWQRDGAASGLLSWSEAVTYCEALSLGGYETWRLPTLRELSTLVDEATVAPAINTEVFSNTSYGARQADKWYWSSHQAGSSGAYWGINFDDGFTGFNSGSAAWNTFGPSWVKCVHDE